MAVAVKVYGSMRRHSLYPARRRRLARRQVWLALVIRVVVVGGFAFGGGFLGLVAARSFGWVLAGHADGALATVAPVLV